MDPIHLDKYGVPIIQPGANYSVCPPSPCDFCTPANPYPLHQDTGFRWCQEMNTCAASINWDEVYDREF